LSDFLIEKICKTGEKINSDTLKPVTRNALGVTGYEFEAVLHPNPDLETDFSFKSPPFWGEGILGNFYLRFWVAYLCIKNRST